MDIRKALKRFGYIDRIVYQEVLFPTDNFFVDGMYLLNGGFYCAISAPLHTTKGVLKLTTREYYKVLSSRYAQKFDIEIEENPEEIIIRRQYGMRKVLKSEFYPKRYILRVGFPDFPPCPYGHTFKMLGFDTQEEVYVRLSSSILKEKSLKTIQYKE